MIDHPPESAWKPGAKRWSRAVHLLCSVLILMLILTNWEIYGDLLATSELEVSRQGAIPDEEQEWGFLTRSEGARTLPWPVGSERIGPGWDQNAGVEVIRIPRGTWDEWIAQVSQDGWKLQLEQDGKGKGFTARRGDLRVQIWCHRSQETNGEDVALAITTRDSRGEVE
jgi:hypothetical protein